MKVTPTSKMVEFDISEGVQKRVSSLKPSVSQLLDRDDQPENSRVGMPKKRKVSFMETSEMKSSSGDGIKKKRKINKAKVVSTSEKHWQIQDKNSPKRPMKSSLKTISKPSRHPTISRIMADDKSKPNWKIIKEEAVALKRKRKEKENKIFDYVIQAKKIWEKVRREDCPKKEKAELVAVLHDITKDHMKKMIFASDTSRIVQWLLKLGSPTVRSSVCESLSPFIVNMIQTRFSCHCVKNIFQYGDSECIKKVVNIISSDAIKLVTNMISAPILEDVYSTHATREQKLSMEQQFFGKSWKVGVVEGKKTLKEGIDSSNNFKKNILEDTKANIIRVLNKYVSSSSLLNSVICQYLEVCSPEDRDEVLPLLKDHILSLLGKKHGAQIAMQYAWFGTKKAKKHLVKQLKGKIEAVCSIEDGYWLILALLDSVDDIVLINKIIISEVLNNALNIVKCESGRKVIVYLVCHRDKLFFHPEDIALLKQGDESGTAMKSLEDKRKEILPLVMAGLLNSIQMNVNVWLHDSSVAMVTLAILKSGNGDSLKSALVAVAKYFCSDVKINKVPLVEDSGFNLFLRKLLKFDEMRSEVEEMFSYHLSQAVEPATIRKWITCNKGCFVLVGILETKKKDSISILEKKLTEDIRREIGKCSLQKVSVGARVLTKVMSECSLLQS